MPNLITEWTCLSLWILWLSTHFCECAEKCCPIWEWNPGPSAYRADALPTKLLGQLSIQCPPCFNVLLASNSLSCTCPVVTPSDTQHAIFALLWAPQCSTCWQSLSLLVIVFWDRKMHILLQRSETSTVSHICTIIVHLKSFQAKESIVLLYWPGVVHLFSSA